MMSYQAKKAGEQSFHYNIKKWKKCQFDILHDINENVTLLQFMESVGNFNHAVSIVEY